MDIKPIISALTRHKVASSLIVLEIALSCAIISNAVFLITDRLHRMDRESGIVESELTYIQMSGAGQMEHEEQITREDLRILRGLPGVISASAVNQIPFMSSSWNSPIRLRPDQDEPTMGVSVYFGEESLLDALGVRIVQGRPFYSNEFVDWYKYNEVGSSRRVASTIITRAAAERLFPGKSALGESVYAWSESPLTIVGVVDRLIKPNDTGGREDYEMSIILPIRVPFTMGSYIIRTQPDQRLEILNTAQVDLLRANPSRIVEQYGALDDLRVSFFARDRSMAWLLAIVCISLLIVTALGIVGLTSFWVEQRRKQIGIRRALGATRAQVLAYFQIENFILATCGIAVGMLLAYAFNIILMRYYELPRLPIVYLPIGAAALWLLGQIAVYLPARRAATVPPAVATRAS